MNYAAVIFDLDGVLCHTDRFHYRAWKMIADELGADFDEEDNDRLRGVSRMESLDIILEKYSGPRLSEAQLMALATRKNEAYRESLDDLSPDDLSPSVAETLCALQRDGIRIAVGSSSKNAVLILKKLGIAGRFDAVIGGDMISRAKPDPEVFLKAAAALGLPPKDCLVVEDAETGIRAAAAGGFDSAGIGPARNSPLTTWPIEQVGDILYL
jgi:beta-phosphoglucomutase